MKTLKQGMKDPTVKTLQTELSRLGYKLSADGNFGPGTHAIVKQFQQSAGLLSDGIVGYTSWETLFFQGRQPQPRLTDDDFRFAALLLDCETPDGLSSVCS